MIIEILIILSVVLAAVWYVRKKRNLHYNDYISRRKNALGMRGGEVISILSDEGFDDISILKMVNNFDLMSRYGFVESDKQGMNEAYDILKNKLPKIRA